MLLLSSLKGGTGWADPGSRCFISLTLQILVKPFITSLNNPQLSLRFRQPYLTGTSVKTRMWPSIDRCRDKFSRFAFAFFFSHLRVFPLNVWNKFYGSHKFERFWHFGPNSPHVSTTNCFSMWIVVTNSLHLHASAKTVADSLALALCFWWLRLCLEIHFYRLSVKERPLVFTTELIFCS